MTERYAEMDQIGFPLCILRLEREGEKIQSLSLPWLDRTFSFSMFVDLRGDRDSARTLTGLLLEFR